MVKLIIVEKVFPSQANFLLVRFTDSAAVMKYLLDAKIIVRDRSKQSNCENCLRISIGTKEENNLLLSILQQIKN